MGVGIGQKGDQTNDDLSGENGATQGAKLPFVPPVLLVRMDLRCPMLSTFFLPSKFEAKLPHFKTFTAIEASIIGP